MLLLALVRICVYLLIGTMCTGTFVRLRWIPQTSHEFSKNDLDMWKFFSVLLWPLTLCALLVWHCGKWAFITTLAIVQWFAEIPLQKKRWK